MEVAQIQREKIFAEIIAERDAMILNLHFENMQLKGQLENANAPPGPTLVPKDGEAP